MEQPGLLHATLRSTTMARRHRAHCGLMCPTVCAALVTAWVVSIWRDMSYFEHAWGVSLYDGRIAFDWFEGTSRDLKVFAEQYRAEVVPNGWAFRPRKPWPKRSVGLVLRKVGLSKPALVRFAPYSWLPMRIQHSVVVVPMWMFVAPLAGVTAITSLRCWISRVRPGHCETCGYNLTGNVSGRCPECGSLVRGRVLAAISKGDA